MPHRQRPEEGAVHEVPVRMLRPSGFQIEAVVLALHAACVDISAAIVDPIGPWKDRMPN